MASRPRPGSRMRLPGGRCRAWRRRKPSSVTSTAAESRPASRSVVESGRSVRLPVACKAVRSCGRAAGRVASPVEPGPGAAGTGVRAGVEAFPRGGSPPEAAGDSGSPGVAAGVAAGRMGPVLDSRPPGVSSVLGMPPGPLEVPAGVESDAVEPAGDAVRFDSAGEAGAWAVWKEGDAPSATAPVAGLATAVAAPGVVVGFPGSSAVPTRCGCAGMGLTGDTRSAADVPGTPDATAPGAGSAWLSPPLMVSGNSALPGTSTISPAWIMAFAALG